MSETLLDILYSVSDKDTGVMPKCSCMTKTPDPDYHKEDCPVKINNQRRLEDARRRH